VDWRQGFGVTRTALLPWDSFLNSASPRDGDFRLAIPWPRCAWAGAVSRVRHGFVGRTCWPSALLTCREMASQ
jgi:hypothetical protein